MRARNKTRHPSTIAANRNKDLERQWKSDIRKLEAMLKETEEQHTHTTLRKKLINLKDVSSRPEEASTSIDSNPHSFLAEAQAKLDTALRNGFAPQTNRNYSYAVRRFKKFATQCGIPAHRILPANSHIVCLWIASGLGSTGTSTAKTNLSALAAWHKMNGLPFNPPPQMTVIKKAISAHWPTEKRKKPLKKPVSPAMIRALEHAWSGGSPIELCALAIALVAWCGQVRLGELLPMSQTEVDPKRIPRRKDWHLSTTRPGASRIEVPWTKTTYFGGETVYLSPQSPPFDPNAALTNHLVASPLSDLCFLFEYTHNRTTVIMDKVTFMTMANTIWSSFGWPHITGHSFRIGGTTAYLRNGVPPTIVKKMGRWSSDAFLLYWRDNEEIFASHASNLDFIDFDI